MDERTEGKLDTVSLFKACRARRSPRRPDRKGRFPEPRDGRSPGLRVVVLSGLPGKIPVACRTHSPLTVAGAASVSVPDGYASPCSLLRLLRRVARGRTVHPFVMRGFRHRVNHEEGPDSHLRPRGQGALPVSVGSGSFPRGIVCRQNGGKKCPKAKLELTVHAAREFIKNCELLCNYYVA
jgi:hypothetical protein